MMFAKSSGKIEIDERMKLHLVLPRIAKRMSFEVDFEMGAQCRSKTQQMKLEHARRPSQINICLKLATRPFNCSDCRALLMLALLELFG